MIASRLSGPRLYDAHVERRVVVQSHRGRWSWTQTPHALRRQLAYSRARGTVDLDADPGDLGRCSYRRAEWSDRFSAVARVRRAAQPRIVERAVPLDGAPTRAVVTRAATPRCDRRLRRVRPVSERVCLRLRLSLAAFCAARPLASPPRPVRRARGGSRLVAHEMPTKSRA